MFIICWMDEWMNGVLNGLLKLIVFKVFFNFENLWVCDFLVLYFVLDKKVVLFFLKFVCIVKYFIVNYFIDLYFDILGEEIFFECLMLIRVLGVWYVIIYVICLSGIVFNCKVVW